ncbi:response regulator [Paenibacillus sp. HB172176]|uniref:response regulator transcription factor n=1 Tax=Paenibacillus sp. HB172176 TaxID=2493690 RepID=UPI00143B71DA|nr:response regulator [Paenibacillus sp. HB172176]
MLKVVLVEDEAQIRRGLKILLEEIIGGYVVAGEAPSGQAAMQVIQTFMPDLVITDIRMPDMDGITLMKNMKQLIPDIPFLILSGYDDFLYMREAIRLHAVDYLLKPVDNIEFAQSLEKWRKGVEGEASPTDASHIIRQVKTYIQENLNEDLSLQQAADQVQLNYHYLSTLFKRETGKPYIEYVIDERMKRGKQLLRTTNLKIYEVASMCGYPTPKHFATVFKQRIGSTPGDYRNERG